MIRDRIFIFDTTLRDGEQVPGCKLNTAQKLDLAKQLEKMGVDVIEAGFPISSPGDFEAVDLISRNMKIASVCGLSRAVKKDIEVAAEALKNARYPRIHTGIGVSDSHVYDKLKTTREKILEKAEGAVKLAKRFVGDVEFYAEDAGRADLNFLCQVVDTVIKAGATVINIPDTTGYCLPEEYGHIFKYIIDNVDNAEEVTLSAHCHNDLGMATANSIAAVQNGAKQIECTMNGIGERAGNTALEEVVMIMRQRFPERFYTQIRTPLLKNMSMNVSEQMGAYVQANKAIVGDNAFAHSSGIHQDGVIKNRETYEIIDPRTVGVDHSSISLTARSGRAALAYKARQIGYEFNKEELDLAYTHFIDLADRQKEVSSDNLQVLFKGLFTAVV